MILSVPKWHLPNFISAWSLVGTDTQVFLFYTPSQSFGCHPKLISDFHSTVNLFKVVKMATGAMNPNIPHTAFYLNLGDRLGRNDQ